MSDARPARSLRDELRVARRRQGRLGIALAIVTAVGVAGVYVPARRSIASAQTAIVEIDEQVENDRSRAVALPQVREVVDDLRKQVDRYRPIRDAADFQQAIVQIGAIKAETALQNYKFETTDVRSLGTCQERRVRITFVADFIDAISFVGKIEAMDRLVRVRELRITGRKGDAPAGAGNASTGRVGVELALSLFYKVDDR